MYNITNNRYVSCFLSVSCRSAVFSPWRNVSNCCMVTADKSKQADTVRWFQLISRWRMWSEDFKMADLVSWFQDGGFGQLISRWRIWSDDFKMADLASWFQTGWLGQRISKGEFGQLLTKGEFVQLISKRLSWSADFKMANVVSWFQNGDNRQHQGRKLR